MKRQILHKDFSTAIICFATLLSATITRAQQPPWHNIQRQLRYHPEGNDIVIQNGDKRFNRALYGGNTAFRAESGDLPEFALYMPGMGGNLQFGIIAGDKSKWLIKANSVKAIYRAGSMLYEIKDPLLKDGVIYLDAIASYDQEALIVKCQTKNIPEGIQLVVVYGGATGKKFSRDGDIGADPESSFYLKPEYCSDNIYKLNKNSFSLLYGFAKPLTEEQRYEVQHLPVTDTNQNNKTAEAKKIAGIFPDEMNLKIGDANAISSPIAVLNSNASPAPVIAAKKWLKKNEELYFLIGNQQDNSLIPYSALKNQFDNAEKQRSQIANRVTIKTPDPYINTLGGVLSIAADAIWESPSYLHGAVAWRMRLDGWRGAYIGDVFGWNDRAREHFNSYAASQLTAPPTMGVVMDTDLHLARHLEKIGTALFSDGYISRNPNDTTHAHHYDMNLVFIDELLNHFNWTGDTNYVRQMWPVIKRHLAWEKRNFDADGDGLYDSYAAIWASDALQYSGGGVTHSSAYNYRANKMAAELAKLIGEDGSVYENEANKILTALNKKLWMTDNGWWAEYKDLLGNQLVHPSAGLWTIYHAIDEGICDPFQAYQSLRYIDNNIPHIQIRAKGLTDTSLYTLSTTNWQPYTWSLNNVALAENLHTALAYWQGGRGNEAYKIWKGNLVESMYLGSSPGNIQQLSFYDAIRGELYRDFADPIGMAGRSLIEGLFGIKPDALHDSLTIQPGFPSNWNYANIKTPDVVFDFKRNGDRGTYFIKQSFRKKLLIKLILPVKKEIIASITVNKRAVKWKIIANVGEPLIEIDLGSDSQYDVSLIWRGKKIETNDDSYSTTVIGMLKITYLTEKIIDFNDPEKIFASFKKTNRELTVELNDKPGMKTFFIKLQKGIAQWWEPINITIPVKGRYSQLQPSLKLRLAGTLHNSRTNYEEVDLRNFFNDKVTNIFKHQYLSPRPAGPTLQLPTQGIGNWAYPLTTANIDDIGLRKFAGTNNEIKDSNGIPFSTPSDTTLNNILFTSQWNNFPKSITVPLSGNASEIYLLMAGSTNPMQSRMTNGMVVINYEDGSADTLLLKNPENWWPIEQDYYVDGFAFTTTDAVPERLYLKQGKFASGLSSYTTIRGFSNRAIDCGAATVLNMFLNKKKDLKSMTVHAVANDVIIGLMAATLVR